MDSNVWALLVASIVAFFAGWLWYSPLLFGKMFMKEEKITEAMMKKEQGKSMARGMMLEVVGTVIGVVALNWFMNQLALIEYREVWSLVLVLWLGLKLPVALSAMAWQEKSYRTVILNLHSLVSLGLAGSVLVAWK